MARLLLPTALFVGGVIGLVVCLFAFIEGRDHPLYGAIALVCTALGFRELRFELGSSFEDVGEAE